MDDRDYQLLAPKKKRKKPRSCLGCLWRLVSACLWVLLLIGLAVGVFLFSFVLFPPFGQAKTARVLLVGLDEKPRIGTGPQRSDSIMLVAARVDGSGTTLLSVPRDARVQLPDHHRFTKINAAYADGGVDNLRDTLAQPDTLQASLPYYMIYDSKSVEAMVNAMGGIDVDVDRLMDYDDNWAGLHIHLQKGRHHLTGTQAVGYLRWRKNNHGVGGSSDDFSRMEHQREFLAAVKSKMKSWDGIRRMPKIYQAFKGNVQTNLGLTQMMALAWAAREMHPLSVPGEPRTIGGVSYVICDWPEGQRLWTEATK